MRWSVMNYQNQQQQVQKQHHKDISWAMLRVVLVLITTLSLGGLAIDFLFDHESIDAFSALYLVIVVLVASGVTHAFSRYGRDAKAADARRERSLRMLKVALNQQANQVFS